MDTVTWTPDVVEDLLFRQFIQDEDVSRMLPPAPKTSSENYLEKYDQTTKILFAYVRNGPVSALSMQNVNTANSKYGASAAAKAFVARTPVTKPAAPEPTRTFTRTATPPPPTSPTPTTTLAPAAAAVLSKAASELPVAQRQKRQRVEWPLNVPTNQMLKSNSRSKVAHLTAKRVAAQQGVDPDIIFRQNSGDLPLQAIFVAYPKALKSVSAVRNASGDWRADAFTVEEEDLYKSELGFTACGPSQCGYGQWLPPAS